MLGAKTQIDNYLSMRGLEPKNVKGYRITDEHAMLAAMEAAGTSRMLVEAQLSKVQQTRAPCIKMCHSPVLDLVTAMHGLHAPALLLVTCMQHHL